MVAYLPPVSSAAGDLGSLKADILQGGAVLTAAEVIIAWVYYIQFPVFVLFVLVLFILAILDMVFHEVKEAAGDPPTIG